MPYTFDQVGTFFVVLIGIMGFIVLVANVSNALSGWYKSHKQPVDNIETRVVDLERWRVDVDKKLEGDWDYRQEQRELNRLMLRSVDSLVGHALDKNNTKKLEIVQQELDDYLTDHQTI